ncbi:DUF2306 domain-containing protein [Burkholderiales bacterium]|nr:DUF2306 domain-containing protein [Burkholderiales bacterium]
MDILLSQSQPIPLHALAAIVAILLGAIQLLSRKGTLIHKALGWVWVLLMLVVSVSSLFIHEINMWGKYSPIHILSLWTIFCLLLAIYFVRIGNIKRHKQTMTVLYLLALILTGLFTLLPGRVMHVVIFG